MEEEYLRIVCHGIDHSCTLSITQNSIMSALQEIAKRTIYGSSIAKNLCCLFRPRQRIGWLFSKVKPSLTSTRTATKGNNIPRTTVAM